MDAKDNEKKDDNEGKDAKDNEGKGRMSLVGSWLFLLTKHGRFCKQKQPTSYQTQFDLKDNSIVFQSLFQNIRRMM